jgi:hypothetical protein
MKAETLPSIDEASPSSVSASLHADEVPRHQTPRQTGSLPLEQYGAIGEGRSVALSGEDGSLDWWCAPNMDSAPLFDRLLDAPHGGYFVIQPDRPFTVTRHYRDSSNVLETVFTTDSGEAVLT